MRRWIEAALELAVLAAAIVLALFAPVADGQPVAQSARGRQAMGQPVLD